MSTNRFVLFAESFRGFIDHGAKSIMRDFKNGLKVPGLTVYSMDIMTLEDITGALFRSVMKSIVDKPANGNSRPNPEATVAELIRRGVPVDQIEARFNHVNAHLPNASYRLYRSPSGYAQGTVRISRNNSDATVATKYSSEELAEFILLLDPLLPEIDKAGEELYSELKKELVRQQADKRALEIEKKAVLSQLSSVLPALGIACSFKIDNGNVHLDLTRTFQGSVDVPLAELSTLLSDPAKLESVLSIAPDPEVSEERQMPPRRFPPGPFDSGLRYL